MQPDFSALFQSLPNAYLVLTADLKVAAANDAYLSLAEATIEQLAGKPALVALPKQVIAQPADADNITSLLHRVLQSKKAESLTAAPKNTGSVIHVSPVMNNQNGVDYILLRIDEATEPASLKMEVDRLKKSDKARDQFISTVAHDLRAPLHVISGYAQILLYEYGDKFDEEGKKNLEHIKTQTGNMAEFIASLQAYSRVLNRIAELKPAYMRDIVLDALSDVKNKYSNFKAEVNIGPLPDCNCDAELMRIVWAHLIGNAAKFSAGKNDPLIEIGSTTDKGQTTYYVKDNGAGFDMDYVHKLFQPFEKLHHESDFPGTGLGLAYCRNVIEKHSGQIWAEGKENEGAAFYFTIA